MPNIKTAIKSTNTFIKEYILLVGIVIFLGYWAIVSIDRPIHYSQNMDYGGYAEESMEMAIMADTAPQARMMKSMGSAIRPPIAEADDGFDPETTERKIIKNGNLSLEVENTEESRTLAEKEIENLKGSVTNMNSWQVRPGVLGYNLTVRVPSENLEKLITNLAKIGTKTGEGINTSDITASYQDTENRIDNLEARRDRLKQLLEFETESLSDVLQVDRELSNVQLQIENLEKTQQRRDIDVSYSTLQLNLQPTTQIGDINNPNWSPKKSWKNAVNKLIQSAQGIFDKGLTLIVFGVIWIPILIIGWLLFRRFFRK